ncbi:double zinc ribbon domain-containing protein [Romboutsia sp.]
MSCPNCGVKLKQKCDHCGRALKEEWNYCPYCNDEIKKGS